MTVFRPRRAQQASRAARLRRAVGIAFCALLAAGCQGIDVPKWSFLPGFGAEAGVTDFETDEPVSTVTTPKPRGATETAELGEDGASGVVPASAEGEAVPEGELTLTDAVARALAGSDEIIIRRFIPEETATGVDAERAAFDPTVGAGLGGSYAHQQVGSTVQAYGPGIDRLDTFNVGPMNGTGNQLQVGKRWSTGTRTRLGYTTGYNQTSPTGSYLLVNPAWQSAVALTVEQPLWRGAGKRQNELPILIARSRENGALHEVEITVNDVLRRVHFAYWQVYLAQTEVEDLEGLVREAELTANKEERRLRLGDGSAAEAAQARESLGQLRLELTEARRRGVAASSALRQLLAMPPDSDRPLRVADAPSMASFPLDPELGVGLAVERRPEVRAQKARMTTARLEVERQEAGLKPNVNAIGGYALTGLNNGWGSSLQDFSSGEYDNWSAGVAWQQPLGLRAEKAAVERARLGLSREQATLRALERKIDHEVRQAAADVRFAEEGAAQAEERLEAARTQFEAVKTLHEAGQADLDRFVRARRSYAVALAARREASVRYADAVTAWYSATGTLLTDRMLPGMIANGAPMQVPPAPTLAAPLAAPPTEAEGAL